MTPDLATARCVCRSGAPIVAVRPGRDAVRMGAVDLFTKRETLLEGEVADAFWYRSCWPHWKAVAA